jgi:hypothetical protein
MRKLLAVAVISSLLLALVPQAALAGGPHAVRHRWEGAGIAIGALTLGGLLLGSLAYPAPVVAAPPAVVAPPPVVYYTPPPVVYAPPPPAVYAPAPLVIYRGWGPPRYWGGRHGGHWRH